MMRPATTQEITKTLITLFSVLPPKGMSGTDTEALMAGYLVALDGVTAQALKMTAMAVIKGELDDLSVKVCPTPPELSRAVRKRMKDDRQRELAANPMKPVEPPLPREKSTGYVSLLNAEFQAWQAGVPAGPLMQAAFEKYFGKHHQPRHYDGRPFLMEAPTFKVAQELAKAGLAPPGSLYVARYGAIYSPTPEDDHDTRQQQPSESPAVSAGEPE